ncbi:MAG: hypothetical protein PX634_27030 [Microcystis sp. M53600_WE12]|jgi:hypothetical protein|nr:hypothetical protein [Microcystis sp. M53600_WE12]
MIKLVKRDLPNQSIARLLRLECPDVSFPGVDRSLQSLLYKLTTQSLKDLTPNSLLPQLIFFSSIGCDTSIRTRKNEDFICINLNDTCLLDFIFENRKAKQFVVRALSQMKYSIAERYIYTETMNLFSCALAYENIPPFMLSQIPYSGTQERFSRILTSYFRGISRSQLYKVSVCFDFLHEWSHFALMRSPEAMSEFSSLAESQFSRFTQAFPSYQEVEEFASSAGWQDEVNEALYEEIVRESKDFSSSTFPSMREEVICDIFAVYHLLKHRNELKMSYWTLLKILHVKLKAHHLRVGIKQICEQGNVYNAIKSDNKIQPEKINVFFGEIFDRTYVAGEFLLSFVMDSEDRSLQFMGQRHIEEMRMLNSVFVEAFLFPLRQIIPSIMLFAVEKLKDEAYRDSMEYFAENLKPEQLLTFVKEPSFI